MDAKVIIAIVLLCIALVAFLLLKVAKKHANDDPEKVREREERARAYREQMEENLKAELRGDDDEEQTEESEAQKYDKETQDEEVERDDVPER